MTKPILSIVDAALGNIKIYSDELWGKFLKFDRDAKQICMVFERGWLSLANTHSFDMANQLIQFFNGLSERVTLYRDEFQDQRTGIYLTYKGNNRIVIEQAKNYEKLGGNLMILEITDNISDDKAIKVCNEIIKRLNSQH